MGNCAGDCRNRKGRTKAQRITVMMIGLDNAGKSVVLKRFAGENIADVVPTVGFATTVIKVGKEVITVYDVGGGKKIRGIWVKYFADVHGLFYTVDASDTERMKEAKEVLEEVLQNPRISGKPLVLFANKQDKPGALDDLDIRDELELQVLVDKYKCPCLMEICSATAGEGKKMDIGMKKGLEWLIKKIVDNYDVLNKRVEYERGIQQEAEKKELEERLARVRKAREERAKGDGDESDNIQTLPDDNEDINPFKPINQIINANSEKAQKSKEQRLPTQIDTIVSEKHIRDEGSHGEGSTSPHNILVSPSDHSVDHTGGDTVEEKSIVEVHENPEASALDKGEGITVENSDSDTDNMVKRKKRKKKRMRKGKANRISPVGVPDSDILLPKRPLPPLINKPTPPQAFVEMPDGDARVPISKPNSDDVDIIT